MQHSLDHSSEKVLLSPVLGASGVDVGKGFRHLAVHKEQNRLLEPNRVLGPVEPCALPLLGVRRFVNTPWRYNTKCDLYYNGEILETRNVPPSALGAASRSPSALA